MGINMKIIGPLYTASRQGCPTNTGGLVVMGIKAEIDKLNKINDARSDRIDVLFHREYPIPLYPHADDIAKDDAEKHQLFNDRRDTDNVIAGLTAALKITQEDLS